jgi:hypothetical protein
MSSLASLRCWNLRVRRKSDLGRAKEGCGFWGADSGVRILGCEGGVRILGCEEGADFRVLKKGAS